MATLEKVDVVIVGAGASGSLFASVLAKAGKKVVLLESGPDWQMSDLISSDFWCRRVKPAGILFLLEGKNPYGYAYQAGWGVGGAALHYFANFPRYLPNDFKVKSEHNSGLDFAGHMPISPCTMTRSRRKSAFPGMPKRKISCAPGARPIRCRR
jgi:choline dehydrogenase-like flavoprotein